MTRRKIINITLILFFAICVTAGCLFYRESTRPTVAEPPKVSVILPTYNRENMLPRAMDSILNQTYPHFELIVINDGSKDNTQKILEEYAAKDKRIKIVQHEQNKGLVYGLNEGLDLATGKYIARMDDDDEAYPQRFEKQVAFFEEHPEFAAVGSYCGPFGSPKVYINWKETDPENLKVLTMLGWTPMPHSSAMLNASFLNKHHIRYRQEYKNAEDLALWGDIIFAGGKLTNVPEKLMNLRLHRTNSPEYYQQQTQSMKLFRRNYIKAKYNKEVTGNEHECEFLGIFLEAEPKINFLNRQALESKNKEMCGNRNLEILFFKHPHWKGAVNIDGNTLMRVKVNDKAEILKRTADEITVRWENWGTETFQKAPEDNVYILKQE